jgi:hypothetical protein
MGGIKSEWMVSRVKLFVHLRTYEDRSHTTSNEKSSSVHMTLLLEVLVSVILASGEARVCVEVESALATGSHFCQ